MAGGTATEALKELLAKLEGLVAGLSNNNQQAAELLEHMQALEKMLLERCAEYDTRLAVLGLDICSLENIFQTKPHVLEGDLVLAMKTLTRKHRHSKILGVSVSESDAYWTRTRQGYLCMCVCGMSENKHILFRD